MPHPRSLYMLLSAALISSSMVACGGPNVPDSTTTPPGSFKEAFSQLEARGELPVLDRTDTIAGIDANQNGVRDDIEAFINSLPDTPVQKKRLYNLQRALNNSMLVDLNDKYRLREAANDVSRSVTCVSISYRDPATRPRRSLQIEKMTANTRQRYRAYMKYNSALNGSVFSMVPDSVCPMYDK